MRKKLPRLSEPDIVRDTFPSVGRASEAPIPPAARIATFVHVGMLRKSPIASVTTLAKGAGDGDLIEESVVSDEFVCAVSCPGVPMRSASEQQPAQSRRRAPSDV